MNDVGRYHDKTPTITARRKLSREAIEALSDRSPPRHPLNFTPSGKNNKR